ncbi:MAG: hypothetical protein CFE39_17250 [Comamonadaceae bacterium PBBC2]|nr:MAG: hypothetical protein CFE39_17250 [Comamonadaceae bacterium PBBC2]
MNVSQRGCFTLLIAFAFCITLLSLLFTFLLQPLFVTFYVLFESVYACLRQGHRWLRFDGFDVEF